MRIALTGAQGFTGRFVTAELDRRGLSWVSLEGDITDPVAIEQSVASAPFDGLIHLAAVAFAGGNDWKAFYDVNQLGAFNLLDAVARHHPGATCVLASSAQVYGPSASGLVDETAEPNPASHYAVSKYAMERGAKLWHSSLDLRIARPFNYTGAGQEVRYLIPKIVHHFAQRAPVIELGNTSVLRDFGDVRSVASAYCDLVTSDAPEPVVNLATGRLSSINDIITILSQMTSHSIEIRVNPAFMREGDVPVLGGDTVLLRKAAPSWTPLPLEDTLSWMLAEAEKALQPS